MRAVTGWLTVLLLAFIFSTSSATAQQHMSRLSTIGGDIRAIKKSGNYVYFGEGVNFVAGDISQTSEPRRLAEFHMEDIVESVDVQGNIACVLARTYGLATFDVSDPANPVKLAQRSSPGVPTCVKMFSHYVIVCA